MNNKALIVVFLTSMLLSSSALGTTFKGRIIDADTKEPIEGAVVIAVWHEETATVAGPSSRFKDVKETLTDKIGKWEIKGPKGRVFYKSTVSICLMICQPEADRHYNLTFDEW